MEKKIAILIDAENIPSASIVSILGKLNSYGRVTVKRIYTDWTQPRNSSWKDLLNFYAIKPVQKFAYTTGKSSSDMALIIDAMDLLHTKMIDIFCIVSSDSDYTGLAHRIREEGVMIIGAGKAHTPKALINAYTDFIYLDKTEISEDMTKITSSQDIINIDYKIIHKAFNEAKKSHDGTVLQSRFKEALIKIAPDFTVKNYGFKKFHDFCRVLEGYELIRHKDGSTFSVRKK